MMRLVAAEITKIVKSRTTVVLTLFGVLLIGVGVVFIVTDAAARRPGSTTPMFGVFAGTDPQLASLLDRIGGAYIIVLIVGALSLTTEFRHGTIGRTFMLSPSRINVMGAKLAASALYALMFSLIGVVTIMGALGMLGELSLGAIGDQTLRALIITPFGLMLAAVLGVAIGAVVRSQVLTVAGTLIYAFLVETLIGQFFPDVARWLPFQALGGVFSSPETRAAIPDGFPMPLPIGTASAVFLTYVIALCVTAVTLLRLRDV